MTDARITQTSVEEWAQPNASAQMTQVAVEVWTSTGAGSNVALMTQVAVEQWVMIALPTAAQVTQVALEQWAVLPTALTPSGGGGGAPGGPGSIGLSVMPISIWNRLTGEVFGFKSAHDLMGGDAYFAFQGRQFTPSVYEVRNFSGAPISISLAGKIYTVVDGGRWTFTISGEMYIEAMNRPRLIN